MRCVLVGAGSLAVTTAKLLIEHGHEVVIIEKDAARVERLSEELDCSFIIGDGTRPSILKEIGPKNTAFLLCLTDDDQDNIIASLVGRSLGFGRVVTSVQDTDFGPICTELGLQSPVYLDATIARTLSDMVQGIETAGLSAVLRGGLRFVSVKAQKAHAGQLADLALPKGVRAVAVSRDGDSMVARDELRIEADDEILLVGVEDQIPKLREAFAADNAEGQNGA